MVLHSKDFYIYNSIDLTWDLIIRTFKNWEGSGPYRIYIVLAKWVQFQFLTSNMLLRRSLDVTFLDRRALVSVRVLNLVAWLIVRGAASSHVFTDNPGTHVGLGACACCNLVSWCSMLYFLSPKGKPYHRQVCNWPYRLPWIEALQMLGLTKIKVVTGVEIEEWCWPIRWISYVVCNGPCKCA